MSRLEYDPKNRQSGSDPQDQPQPQQPPAAARAQQFESQPRRPQNFDDRQIWHRDDDPTR
jgi:hypothetical protein